MARANRSKAGTVRQVVLAEDLRVANARATFESLAAHPGTGTLEIDASQVARIDAAGLQALAAALGRLRAAGVEARWKAPAPALAAAAALAGLEAILALP
jgi:anti-anti-sigma regulatory factor